MSSKISLVFSGGGARGAYEAGIIHYLRTMLPADIRNRNFEILCGNSIGAVNTAFMAASANDPKQQGRKICEIWEQLREEDLYRRDLIALLNFVYKSTKGILSNFINSEQRSSKFESFLDTSPLVPTLKRYIPFQKITKNIQSGFIDAISIVATNVKTGRVELFIEKNKKTTYTGEHLTHYVPIQPIHVAASAAIPILFPTIQINGVPYTDGGLRLNTPLSPAIQLGADKILVISLHHHSKLDDIASQTKDSNRAATTSEVLGRVMDSLFVDKIQSDLEQMDRVNRLIDFGESICKGNFLKQFNEQVHSGYDPKSKTARGFKRLKVLRIHPSESLGTIFSHCYESRKDLYFSTIEKLMVRLMDIDPQSGNEFLSYISFMPHYLKTLLYLGFEDAKSHHNELKEFLQDE
ncbi:MAG: patatin-like phospholipase family protein [Deltaproteobacteria bacterium]|nr:patatin-like phospholipase family protein [Deltaproteobacteria bacterium]